MLIAQRPSHRLAGRGMTLIEVLVGIVIGLIGMLVMFQMLSVWDARTRVNASSGDAQAAGTLAMFNLERDIRLAGMGFGGAGANELDCTVNAFDNTASGAANFSLRPVSITDGDALNQPDSIQVLYGNSPFFALPQDFQGATTSALQATQKFGFKPGDVAVMTNGGNTCRLIEITDDVVSDAHTLAFGTTTYADFYNGNPAQVVRWNSASASMPSIVSGNLYSLGPSPRLDDWQIQNSTLGFNSLMGVANVGEFFGVAEGVVGMKAQYGYDTNNDKQIADSEWTKTPPADWTRVRAVRIALLIRGRDFASPNAASGASDVPRYRLVNPPTWSGSASSPFVMKNLDGTTDSDPEGALASNNWRYYRYRVYEKVIPLRNMIWGQS